MVEQPESVVAPCEAPEREEEKVEQKTDEKIREKIEMKTEEKNEEKKQSLLLYILVTRPKLFHKHTETTGNIQYFSLSSSGSEQELTMTQVRVISANIML